MEVNKQKIRLPLTCIIGKKRSWIKDEKASRKGADLGFGAETLGVGGLAVAAHAHGRQFGNAFGQRDQVEDVAESRTLVRAVQGGHHHDLALVGLLFGELDDVGELRDDHSFFKLKSNYYFRSQTGSSYLQKCWFPQYRNHQSEKKNEIGKQ